MNSCTLDRRIAVTVREEPGAPSLLHLSTEPDEINAAINDPSVRPSVGASEAGALDITPLIKPENLFPFGEHGGFALIWAAPRTREVHTFIRTSGRGTWAKEAAQEMIRIAREHGTERLFTRILPDSRNVALFARAAGMRATGEVTDYLGKPHNVYEMEA